MNMKKKGDNDRNITVPLRLLLTGQGVCLFHPILGIGKARIDLSRVQLWHIGILSTAEL